jgi:ribosomal protein S18 acetylase RimI-like enzyme
VGTVSFVDEGGVARLLGLAVTPGSRRRGIGAALVGAIEREARTRGAAVVSIEAPLSAEAVAWLEGLGFTVDLEEDDIADGETVRMVEMTKIL